MTPELNAWLAQIPWVPLGLGVLVIALFLVSQSGGKKKREALQTVLSEGASKARNTGVLPSAASPSACPDKASGAMPLSSSQPRLPTNTSTPSTFARMPCPGT